LHEAKDCFARLNATRCESEVDDCLVELGQKELQT
jgi:hypothetical protein